MLGKNGIQNMTTETVKLRRKVAHAAMIYKQEVMEEGPNYIRDTFQVNTTDPRAALRRQSTIRHCHQMNITYSRNNLKKFDSFCQPLRL